MIASPAADPTDSDRRVAPRLQPAFRTICRVDRPGPAGLQSIGLVWNLSETGLSMMMADPLSPGAEFSGELAPEEGGYALPVKLRIVHVQPSSTGDFILGARFGSRLHPDAVQSFLTSNMPDSSREEIEASPNWMPPKNV